MWKEKLQDEKVVLDGQKAASGYSYCGLTSMGTIIAIEPTVIGIAVLVIIIIDKSRFHSNEQTQSQGY